MPSRKSKGADASQMSQGKTSDKSGSDVLSAEDNDDTKKGKKRKKKKGRKNDGDDFEKTTQMATNKEGMDSSLASGRRRSTIGGEGAGRRRSVSSTERVAPPDRRKSVPDGGRRKSLASAGSGPPSGMPMGPMGPMGPMEPMGTGPMAPRDPRYMKAYRGPYDMSSLTCSCQGCWCRCCQELRNPSKQWLSEAGEDNRKESTRIETVLNFGRCDTTGMPLQNQASISKVASEPALRQYGSQGMSAVACDNSDVNVTVRTSKSRSGIDQMPGSDSDITVNIRVVFRDSHGEEASMTSVVRTRPDGREVRPDVVKSTPSSAAVDEVRKKVSSEDVPGAVRSTDAVSDIPANASGSQGSHGKEVVKPASSKTMLPPPQAAPTIENEQDKRAGGIERLDVPALDYIRVSYSIHGSSFKDSETGISVDIGPPGQSGSGSQPAVSRGTGSAECVALADLETLSANLLKKVQTLRRIHMENKARRGMSGAPYPAMFPGPPPAYAAAAFEGAVSGMSAQSDAQGERSTKKRKRPRKSKGYRSADA